MMDGAELPPWDRLASFATPVETTYTLSGTPLLIAKGDPMRVLLIIAPGGSTSGSSCTISTRSNLSTTTGFSMLSSPSVTSPFIIDYRVWGAVCGLPWYGLSGMIGAIITVLTVSMIGWPDRDGIQGMIGEVENGKFRNGPTGRTRRIRRAQLYGDRWAEWEKVSPYRLPNGY